MLYYRVKRDGVNVMTQARNNVYRLQATLIQGELYTAKEREKMPVSAAVFERVNIKPRDTFTMCGARFPKRGAAVLPA